MAAAERWEGRGVRLLVLLLATVVGGEDQQNWSYDHQTAGSDGPLGWHGAERAVTPEGTVEGNSAGCLRIPTYYINLDRRPDRRRHMEQLFQEQSMHEDLKIMRFTAVDGSIHNFTEEEMKLFSSPPKFVEILHEQYNWKALIANSLSHYRIWEMFLREEARACTHAIILQDDVSLIANFVSEVQALIRANPSDAWVTWIGAHSFANGPYFKPWPLEGVYDADDFSTRLPGHDLVGEVLPMFNPTTLAYVITREGARAFLSAYSQHGFQDYTDHSMRGFLSAHSRNYITRRLLATGIASLGSDVSYMLDKQYVGYLFKFGGTAIRLEEYGEAANVLRNLKQLRQEQDGTIPTEVQELMDSGIPKLEKDLAAALEAAQAKQNTVVDPAEVEKNVTQLWIEAVNAANVNDAGRTESSLQRLQGYMNDQAEHIREDLKTQLAAGLQMVQSHLRNLTISLYMQQTVQPLAFAIPSRKFMDLHADLRSPTRRRQKHRDFSLLVPGSYKTYVYFTERHYYEQYSESYFGLARLRGGYDCIRNYEILLAGALPYYMDIDKVPSQTMFSYPKHLIQQAMSLPGVPSKAEIIRTFHTGEAIKLDHSLFDKEKYFAILTQAQAWAQQHLLTKSVGHRVATAIPAIKSWSSGNMPRVLVHSREVDGPQDYMRDLVVIGLVESGLLVYTTFDNRYLIQGALPTRSLEKLYGRGYTYGGALPSSASSQLIRVPEPAIPALAATLSQQARQQGGSGSRSGLSETAGLDAYIITTKSNRGAPDQLYDQLFPGAMVIFVDGNDIDGNHSVPSCATVTFRRESLV